MVEELIKHHWCDKCGYEKHVEGRGIAIEIDGQRWELDLCPPDEETEIHPVLRFLEEFARPMGGKPAAAPAAKSMSKPSYDTLPGLDASRLEANYPCALCEKNVSAPGNFSTHMKKHGRKAQDVYGLECLECPESYRSYGAFAVHSTSAHGMTVPKMFMQHILAGDPTGMVKRRGLMPS